MKNENTVQPSITGSVTPFEEQLKNQIRKVIRSLKSGGTVAMGVENLKQVVRPPSHMVDGAPAGTNAQWAYAQLFRRVCADDKSIASFLC